MTAPSSPIARLREMVDEAPILGGKPMVDPADLAYALDLLDRCRKTLEPFAVEASEWSVRVKDYIVPDIGIPGEGDDSATFTVGDLRAAHALHAELSEGKE